MKRKNRNQKHIDYVSKYSDIPIDYKERLSWLYDKLHITDVQAFQILNKRDMMLESLLFYDTQIVLFEVPEGSPRPRFRIINRTNISNMALSNPEFVHVYSLTGKEDNVFMKRLMQMLRSVCILRTRIHSLKTTASCSGRSLLFMAKCRKMERCAAGMARWMA